MTNLFDQTKKVFLQFLFMEKLQSLKKRIVARVNANLKGFGFDAGQVVSNAVEYDKCISLTSFKNCIN